MPFQDEATLKNQWKEILALSIFLAILINIGLNFMKKIWKDYRKKIRQTKELAKNKLKEWRDVVSFEIKDKILHFSNYQVSAIDSLNVSSPPPHVSAAPSNDSAVHSSFSAGYDSRYMDDFEHEECLGKGGFGVVFRGKKKIDDCDYAIKRIYLPRCNEAKTKMMREVKALANLSHPGIVRYFHAWWEEPPQDWQKATDEHFFMKDYVNGSSYSLSHDWLMEVDGTSERGCQQKGTQPTKDKKENPLRKYKKKISCDPLGKCYNFDTGIELFPSTNYELNLLDTNVFYSEEEDGISSNIYFDNNHQTECSFDIQFETNSGISNFGDSPADHCHENKHYWTKDSDDSLEDDSEIMMKIDNSGSSIDKLQTTSLKLKRSRRRKKLVGKCCEHSICLRQPPLFLYIQMQLCKKETLKDWLKSKVDGIHLKEHMGIFMQIVDAVAYFHNLGLMHRDLKPANILFSMDGHVKVGDFGLVCAITQPSMGKSSYSLGNVNHTGKVGTQLYMSPEQISGKPYCHKIDIYSLGLIFFELICPFSTQMERMQVIYKLKHGSISEELRNTPQGKLVLILTAEDPDKRPDAEEIKSHSLIAEIYKNMASMRNEYIPRNESGFFNVLP